MWLDRNIKAVLYNTCWQNWLRLKNWGKQVPYYVPEVTEKSVFKAADVKLLNILLSMDDFKSKLFSNGIPFSLDCHHWLLYYVFNYYIFIEKYLFCRMIVKKNWNYESLRKCSCYPTCRLIFSLCTEAVIAEFLFYAKA